MTNVLLFQYERLQEKDKPHTATVLVIKTSDRSYAACSVQPKTSFFTRDCVRMWTEKTTAMSSSFLFSQVPYLLLSPCLDWFSLHVWWDLVTQLSSGVSQWCAEILGNPSPFRIWRSPLFHTYGSWAIAELQIWLCEGTVPHPQVRKRQEGGLEHRTAKLCTKLKAGRGAINRHSLPVLSSKKPKWLSVFAWAVTELIWVCIIITWALSAN